MFVKFFYLFLLTRLTGPAADSLFQLHRNKKDPAEHSHAPQDLPNFSFPNLNGMLSHILPGIANDVWDNGDHVGISILPEKIKIIKVVD